MGVRNILGIFSNVFAGAAPASERQEFGTESGESFVVGWDEDFSNPASGKYPRRKEYNDLFAKLTAVAVDINKYGGALPWSGSITYMVGAHVTSPVTNNLYKCVVSNSNKEPSANGAEWDLAGGSGSGGLGEVYTVTGVGGGTIRSFDRDTATMNDVIDVLATLIEDLS